MQRTRLMKKTTLLASLLAAGTMLSGCEGVKQQLGIGKQSPDEFRVVARAPLSVPPEFNLRPPEPGAVRPQEGTPQDQAKEAVFRAPGGGASQREVEIIQGKTPGEANLLLQAGAAEADPDIRTTVDRETQAINEESDTFINALIFWKDQPQPGTVVDPSAESDRIQENEALGEPVSSGETPTIERREEGLLEGIFD